MRKELMGFFKIIYFCHCNDKINKHNTMRKYSLILLVEILPKKTNTLTMERPSKPFIIWGKQTKLWRCQDHIEKHGFSFVNNDNVL